MATVTKENIKSTFQHFCKAFGFHPSAGYVNGPHRAPQAGMFLDNQPVYGGWLIAEYNGKDTTESHPLTSQRKKGEAFYDAMWFAIRAQEAKKYRER